MGVSCYVAFALAALSSLPFTVGRASAKRPQCDEHPGLRTRSPSWLERRGLFSHQAEIRLLRHDEQVPMRSSCAEEDWMPGLRFGFRNRGAPRLHLCLSRLLQWNFPSPAHTAGAALLSAPAPFWAVLCSPPLRPTVAGRAAWAAHSGEVPPRRGGEEAWASRGGLQSACHAGCFSEAGFLFQAGGKATLGPKGDSDDVDLLSSL